MADYDALTAAIDFYGLKDGKFTTANSTPGLVCVHTAIEKTAQHNCASLK